MSHKLPVFEFLINDDDDSGVKCISMVNDPAMESMFVAFDKDKPSPKYVKFNQYEQVVLGVAIQPDLLIYRNDGQFEYYGKFSKETIKKIVYKFHREQQTKNMNLDHNENKFIDAYMVASYIVDSELQIEDLKNKGIPDTKIGTWMVAYKINDPKVFEKVLSGEFRGFSIESYLDSILVQMNNKSKKEKEKMNKKSILDKIINLFRLDVFESSLVPELGFEIEWSEVGLPVNKVEVDANGNETTNPVGQGEFTTEMGVVVVDESSNLVEVRELPVVEPVVPEATPEVPIEETLSEAVALVDPLVPEVPEVEVPEVEPVVAPEVPVVDVKSKTIGDVVGINDGEYWIKVCVVGGEVTEAEVSSETNLLKSQVAELSRQKMELEEKLNEPIGEPILTPEVPVKDYSKMSAYEKAVYKANNRK